MRNIGLNAAEDEIVLKPPARSAQTYRPVFDMPQNVITKLENFFGQYRTKTYAKGQIFLFPEEGADCVFYLVSGNVRMYDISNRGSEVVVGVFKPHSLFPLGVVFNHAPNYYFFEASTAIKIQQAPARDTMEFIQQNADIAFDLLTESYITAESNRRRMAHLMAGSANNRLLYELTLQAYRFGQPYQDNAYLVDVTETEIGARSGLSRETVSREIRKLKNLDLISVRRDGIFINDILKLEVLLGANL